METITHTEGAAEMRLRLAGQGWRSLSDATDPRRAAAARGTIVTVAYWPEFKELGVPAAMFKEGAVEVPDSAAWSETYIRGNTTWMPGE